MANRTSPSSSKTKELSLDDFEVLQEIGSGSFGKVYKIMRKVDQKILVWKVIHYGIMTSKERELLVSEVNIIKDLSHPFIVRYYDRIIDRTRKNIHIIMEYCPSGDLSQFIKLMKRECKLIDEETIWRIFTQICMALKACHCRTPLETKVNGSPTSPATSSAKIIHRDLKPGNIMLDHEYNIKLGDFGLAKILTASKQYAHTHVGTPYYMSPEQITDSGYDEKGDIWSLGCIVYELCTLSPPFEASNHLALALKIKKGAYKPIDNSQYSSCLIDLVGRMLTVDPVKRIHIEQICELFHMKERILDIKYRERFKVLKKREEELKRDLERIRREREELRRREELLAERTRGFEMQQKEFYLKQKSLVDKRSLGYSTEVDDQNKENQLVQVYHNFKVA